MQTLGAILGQVDIGKLSLPKFQRGYVWQRPQVRELMQSLYRGFPVGSFLVWNTPSGTFLLDGQQRITSLYGIIRGKAPEFSDADPDRFMNLYFNMDSQEFEFYGKTKMQHNPHWVSVTEVMKNGIESPLKSFEGDPKLMTYLSRLNRIVMIASRTFYVEPIDGDGRDLDEIVEMFNQVNSGGTKLSKGDLALAKISADWPQARAEMKKRLAKWEAQGHNFKFDWLLRCINGLVTGQSQFEHLDTISTETLRDGLKRAEKHIDSALSMISARLGLDHHQVMGSPNSLAAIVRYFDQIGEWPDQATVDRLLYWYIHAMLWRRYSGPTETVMRQDLMAIDEGENPIEALIERLRQNRGSLTVLPDDFAGWTRGSVFYPMLYMLTRVYGTRNLCSGLQLSKHLLGKDAQLELHHIFPKAQLRKRGYLIYKEVNAVANFTFLTEPCNKKIRDRLPTDYFPEFEAKHPGILASHWIPDNPELWKIENYREFLAARRKKLARAANDFLSKLWLGTAPISPESEHMFKRKEQPRPVSIASDKEEAELRNAMSWMENHSLPRGEYGYELVDAKNQVVSVLDLAWPSGIQEGLSKPAALLIDEDNETLAVASQSGFMCFLTFEELKDHVKKEIIGHN